MALPQKIQVNAITGASLPSTIDGDLNAGIKQPLIDIFGIPDNTNISAAGLNFVAGGLDRVIFQDAAGSPSAAGRFQRNGTNLEFHDGTAARIIANAVNTVTLTNKTVDLASNTVTGTTAQFNTALSDGDFATLAGSENLTNKTLTSPTLAGTPVFPDNVFTIGGSADATKKLAFEVDGITTGTVRTVTAQNQNGTMALLTDAFTTGDVKLTFKTVADTSWVLMNDTTIGNAASGATGRANADTVDLFTLLWTNVVDQWAPVSTGRGASAAADYAANKTLALPKTLGRALAGYGIGTTLETVTASSGNGFTVLANNTTWITGMPVVWSALSGFTTSGSAGPTYYAVRISSTNVRFATTLALAQNNTPDITISGSGSATLTYTFTSRAIGETAGEEAHAQSITELLAHSHTVAAKPSGVGGGTNFQNGVENPVNVTSSTTGGNAAMNIISPTTFLNVMVKL